MQYTDRKIWSGKISVTDRIEICQNADIRCNQWRHSSKWCFIFSGCFWRRLFAKKHSLVTCYPSSGSCNIYIIYIYVDSNYLSYRKMYCGLNWPTERIIPKLIFHLDEQFMYAKLSFCKSWVIKKQKQHILRKRAAKNISKKICISII